MLRFLRIRLAALRLHGVIWRWPIALLRVRTLLPTLRDDELLCLLNDGSVEPYYCRELFVGPVTVTGDGCEVVAAFLPSSKARLSVATVLSVAWAAWIRYPFTQIVIARAAYELRRARLGDDKLPF